MANFLTQLATSAAKGAINSPAMQVNKERAAVVAHDGYFVKDTIAANQYPIFVVGLIGVAFSGYAMTKRKSGEARVLYSLTGLASFALAWAARPWVKPTPPGSVSTTSTMIGILDRRAKTLKRQDPQFADRVLGRVLTDTGLDKSPLRDLISA